MSEDSVTDQAADVAAPSSGRSGAIWIRWTTIAVVTVIAVLGSFGHGRHVVHVRPGGAVFDDQVLPAFFLLFLASALIAVRWPRVGGWIAVFAAAGIVPFAVDQLRPWSAALVIAVFALPAVVWLALATLGRPHAQQRTDIARRQAISTIAGVVIAAAGGTLLGRYVYDRIWGPTHPESSTPKLPDSLVDWFWCGAVTTSECVVRARPRASFDEARIVVGTTADLTDATAVTFFTVYDRVVEFRVGDLVPDTDYTYAFEFDGEVDQVRVGSFRTFPDSRRPVRLVFASCARVGSNGMVFDAIRAEDPIVYVCIGDFHYGDNFVDDVDDYRQVFDIQLTRPAQAALYASTPIAYVWDDHDYGPNDSDKTAPGRNAAMTAYREYVPHYDLAGPVSAIFQAFTVGSVRVILTDARSARDPDHLPDDAGKSMLGTEQRDWLLAELASSAPDHDLVIWANPVPWVAAPENGADSWGGYTHERALIAQHIADHAIDNLLMVCGDAHMVAIDDGTHTNYSSTPGPGFPLIHVAALDRPGSTKGGPYTAGPIPGGGHFAVVEVTPGGDRVEVDLAARDWRGERLLHHRFDAPSTTA